VTFFKVFQYEKVLCDFVCDFNQCEIFNFIDSELKVWFINKKENIFSRPKFLAARQKKAFA
jgi:hypothetical protein